MNHPRHFEYAPNITLEPKRTEIVWLTGGSTRHVKHHRFIDIQQL
jgi:hypothetical protein